MYEVLALVVELGVLHPETLAAVAQTCTAIRDAAALTWKQLAARYAAGDPVHPAATTNGGKLVSQTDAKRKFKLTADDCQRLGGSRKRRRCYFLEDDVWALACVKHGGPAAARAAIAPRTYKSREARKRKWDALDMDVTADEYYTCVYPYVKRGSWRGQRIGLPGVVDLVSRYRAYEGRGLDVKHPDLHRYLHREFTLDDVADRATRRARLKNALVVRGVKFAEYSWQYNAGAFDYIGSGAGDLRDIVDRLVLLDFLRHNTTKFDDTVATEDEAIEQASIVFDMSGPDPVCRLCGASRGLRNHLAEHGLAWD